MSGQKLQKGHPYWSKCHATVDASLKATSTQGIAFGEMMVHLISTALHALFALTLQKRQNRCTSKEWISALLEKMLINFMNRISILAQTRQCLRDVHNLLEKKIWLSN